MTMTYKTLMAAYVTPIAPIPTACKPSIKPKGPVRAVLFDVYGTLFVSASGDIHPAGKEIKIDSRLTALVEKYRLPLPAGELTDRFFRAVEKTHAAMKNRGVDFPEVDVDRIWMEVMRIEDIQAARRFAVEYEMIVNPVYPMPHLSEVIETLKKKGIQLGIVSNAQFYTPHLFALFCGGFPEQLGFNPALVFYSYQHGQAKPSPLMYHLAAEKLNRAGISTATALYVGNDMRNDILPAHSAGFQTCLFAGDARSLRLRQDDTECASLSPDMVITDLIQLLDRVTA